MKLKNIIGLRMERQKLTNQASTKEEYMELFRNMQPITPLYFSRPGDPPCLVHRVSFDDRLHNDILRSNRNIVKARFQGGTVGYVAKDDFELYIAAYRKPIDKLTFKHKYILDTITHTGPLSCKQIKEETGILNKEITPVLHRLQEAFLVYEDQVDGEWDRAWYDFENEWYDIDINRYTRIEAIKELILKFLHMNVFSNIQNLKDWLKLPLKYIKDSLNHLEKQELIAYIEIDGMKGWMNAGDIELLENNTYKIPFSVYVLHKSDFLVKANDSILKDNFENKEVLQYILIDGEFKGAVLGHWRIGPHNVDDIVFINMSDSEKEERKSEILKAVAMFYKPPFSNILMFDGRTI